MNKKIALTRIVIDLSLGDIAELLKLPFFGENIRLDGFNLSNREIEADSVISYCTSEKYLSYAINNPKIKALILSECLYNSISESIKKQFSFIISKTPEWTFYKAYHHCIDKGLYPLYTWETKLGNATLLPGSIVENGVIIGDNVTIGNNTVIKSGTIIGDNVRIGSCCVIGADGFQLIKDDMGRNHTISHVGRTYIGDHVTIGDNSTISRSLFEGYTFIGDNTKMSSHVHIAHNCIVDEDCVMTVGACLMGSAVLQRNVWMAPYSCVMNQTVIAENTMVGTMSFAKTNTVSGSVVVGIPAKELRKIKE